jgi:hypothetical protein
MYTHKRGKGVSRGGEEKSGKVEEEEGGKAIKIITTSHWW